jgi:hypothetical protein
MKRPLFMAVVIIAVCFLAVGCASTPALAFFGNYYSDAVTVGEKRGEATSRVYFSLFGQESYPSVERVAKENEITKLATVEHYSRLGFLGIWIDYTTIVTGQ